MHSLQRKRFSYLTVQQRALNSSNVIDSDKAAQSRYGSVFGSNTKASRNKEELIGTQQIYKSFSRSSSIKKQSQPLSELSQNLIFSSIRNSATNHPTVSNKQNLPFTHSNNKTNQKPSIITLTSRPVANTLTLQARIRQIQQENSFILKQTQEKFFQMERHLERVEGILKEKEGVIGNLVGENEELRERCKGLEKGKGELGEQKEELIRIINGKNEEIKKWVMDRQLSTKRQEQLLAQLNTYTLQSQLSTLQQSTQPQSLLPTHQSLSSETQTTLTSCEIDQLTAKSKQSQAPTDKLNYRQKYQALFKRALQMEDQMYKLKEELFDSQNQVKTIQQEFNTYKIFNQIEKINMGEK